MNTIDPSQAYQDDLAIQTVIDGKRGVGFYVMIRPEMDKYKDLYQKIVDNGLEVISIGDNNAYVYYRKGYQQQAHRLANIASKNAGYLPTNTAQETREIGLLLGYNPDAVDTFVNNKFPNINETRKMKKLIITESQYNLIKNVLTEENILTENMKDVVICVRSIMKSAKNDNLSNYNKVRADKLISNKSVMTQIKSTFEDQDKLDVLIDEFKNVGMQSPEVELAKEAHDIIDEFNKLAQQYNMDLRMDTDAINNLRQLNN